MSGCNGTDVSNNNRVNGQPIKLTTGFPGLAFVLAKATEGNWFTDEDYGWYSEQAAAAGALFGAYHFAHPENGTAASEADHFMTVAKPHSSLSIWWDYEQNQAGEWPGISPAADAAQFVLFTGTIRHDFPHARVGLYSNVDGFFRILPELVKIGAKPNSFPTWLAFPNGELETPTHPMPAGWAWTIHQYETYAGVDRNYSRMTRDQLRQFFGNWPAA